MVKQKIVITLSIHDNKRRSKALQTAVGLHGVISASVDGDKLVVIGDGVDAIEMTVMLRKKMGNAELLSVGSAEEKKEVKPPPPAAKEPEPAWTVHPAFCAPAHHNLQPAYSIFDWRW